MAVQPEVVLGDITRLEVDVIVNAANPSLLGGCGVDGAIHRAAGPELLAACKVVRQQQGECPPGHAVITAAGNLPASAVIHAVGPVWHGGDRQEAELLADVYKNSLLLASANNYRSIAFPAISTGVYGYPKQAAAEIAVRTVTACKVVRQQQGECPPGHAVITAAGNLPASAVIHAVGPVWHGGDRQEAELLADVYKNSLLLASANNYRSIAFPAISTGVYGYPKQAAAEIAVRTVTAFLTRYNPLERVYFVCFDSETAGIYTQLLEASRAQLGHQNKI